MCRRFRYDAIASDRRSVAATVESAARKKGGDRAARRVRAALSRIRAEKCRRGRKTDESSAATRRDTMLRSLTRQTVPLAGGRLPRLVRQASVRFGDDFAVFQVEGPGFCDQLANTCEPASGFGGTVRNIRRLHDETPDKWWIRDNPDHKETSPLCEMRFRYMRIPDTLCCCCATRGAPMRIVVASRRDEAVASTASRRGNGKGRSAGEDERQSYGGQAPIHPNRHDSRRVAASSVCASALSGPRGKPRDEPMIAITSRMLPV